MATLLFLLLKLAGKIDSPYDCFAFCGILALDTSTALRWFIWRQRRE